MKPPYGAIIAVPCRRFAQDAALGPVAVVDALHAAEGAIRGLAMLSDDAGSRLEAQLRAASALEEAERVLDAADLTIAAVPASQRDPSSVTAPTASNQGAMEPAALEPPKPLVSESIGEGALGLAQLASQEAAAEATTTERTSGDGDAGASGGAYEGAFAVFAELGSRALAESSQPPPVAAALQPSTGALTEAEEGSHLLRRQRWRLPRAITTTTTTTTATKPAAADAYAPAGQTTTTTTTTTTATTTTTTTTTTAAHGTDGDSAEATTTEAAAATTSTVPPSAAVPSALPPSLSSPSPSTADSLPQPTAMGTDEAATVTGAAPETVGTTEPASGATEPASGATEPASGIDTGTIEAEASSGTVKEGA